MNCEMCGREEGLFKTDVEGSVLNLCRECSKFGKVIFTIREEPKKVKKRTEAEEPLKEEIVLGIVPGYGSLIKQKRESMGIKQEDFAKQINEKISLIHKIETGHFEPSLALVHKIEKFLGIKLIEQQELKKEGVAKEKREHFTIGDFIKIKK